MSNTVTREHLIASLEAALRPLPFIHAAWIEGADAAGRADTYSDLDLWLDVDAPQVISAFATLRQTLEMFGPIDVDDGRMHPHPLLHQRFFRSTGLPKFWFLDVVIQEHGRDVTFGPHDPCRVLFDHSGVIRRSGEDSQDMAATMQTLVARHWRWVLVEKELRRGHRLEALAYYHSVVLDDLVTLLRLRSCPGKAGYGLKHVMVDLPAADVRRLEALYDCTSVEELWAGLVEAEHWYTDLDDQPQSVT